MNMFEEAAIKEGITIENEIRYVDIGVTPEDIGDYTDMLDEMYESNIRIVFVFILERPFVFSMCEYWYDKGLREGDIVLIVGGGLNELQDLKT